MKYSLTATKQDYSIAYKTLESLEIQLKTKFDWKKIKRVSLDELSTVISILKRKLPSKPIDIVVTKIKNIDIDNIRLGVIITKDGEKFETAMQYIISSNSVHHSDIEFENLMETFEIDINQIINDIENRKIQIQ